MSQEVAGTNPEVEQTVIDYKAEYEKTKATNDRLLEESRKNRERAKLADLELQKFSEESNGKEKDISKILEVERKKLDKFASENKRLKAETLNSKIRSSISKYAEDVIDLDDLLNQPKFGDILKKGIDVDELTVDDDVMKEYVDTVLKAKPHLRKQPEATTMLTRKPGFSTTTNKSLDQMTTKEMEELAYKLYGNK
jgi:hypothetical protein